LDDLLSICHSCLNSRVLVSTVDGRVHEGVLLHFDSNNIYLDRPPAYISNKVNIKGFGFRNSILTLALFDILAISLVAGGRFW
jgi:small nuclear ribonucleoprotein (snRNP)-like protein